MATEDPWEEAKEWLDHANNELRPMIEDSVYTIGLYTPGDPDAKQAVEVGFTLLLGKPLVLAVTPGAVVPPGLARAAEAIVEYDVDDMEGTTKRLNAVMDRIAARYKD